MRRKAENRPADVKTSQRASSVSDFSSRGKKPFQVLLVLLEPPPLPGPQTEGWVCAICSILVQ